MSTDYEHRDYFQRIAPRYRSLRTTDREPTTPIVRQLNALNEIEAADIGCGTGRYTQLLLRRLRDKLSYIYCIDYSANMLEQLKRHFGIEDVRATGTIRASAMCLPLRDESLNCIFTFNAVHHFSLRGYLRETARILRDGGYLFVYTRLRSQNSRSVWGRFFPMFASKETRLYEAEELQQVIAKIPGLSLQRSQTFKFDRKSNLQSLSDRAKSHYYSTFDLYSKTEFNMALNRFHDNLRERFDDLANIQWVDENILLILQKAG